MAQVGASTFYHGDTGSYHVKFLVYKVALGKVYLPRNLVVPCQYHYKFICHSSTTNAT